MPTLEYSFLPFSLHDEVEAVVSVSIFEEVGLMYLELAQPQLLQQQYLMLAPPSLEANYF